MIISLYTCKKNSIQCFINDPMLVSHLIYAIYILVKRYARPAHSSSDAGLIWAGGRTKP